MRKPQYMGLPGAKVKIEIVLTIVHLLHPSLACGWNRL
jgi:hypothetical protein